MTNLNKIELGEHVTAYGGAGLSDPSLSPFMLAAACVVAARLFCPFFNLNLYDPAASMWTYMPSWPQRQSRVPHVESDGA